MNEAMADVLIAGKGGFVKLLAGKFLTPREWVEVLVWVNINSAEAAELLVGSGVTQ